MDSLSGSLVKLRPLRDEDFEFLAGLRNDMRTQGWNQRLPPCYTPKMVKDRVEKNYAKPNQGVWGIETKDGRLVGYINYEEAPPRLGATIGVITCVESWGKGHAREAMELILRFLFEERGLQVASLWTLSDRVRMIGLAEKLGFKVSARLRENAIVGGKVCDTIVMDMIREEYRLKHSKMAGT